MSVPPLSHLRFRVEQSEGRRYPEPAHPYRSDFQRDRDRVIHSRAFRRMEDKTQVFTYKYSDHFRNRLTHTIEVAQIARTLATLLGLDETLTEVLALVHDVGHPPFAHSGEDELDRRMKPFGESFDHNLHALRIVETFERRYARFPGLNLTYEVREGIAKHSRDFERGESQQLDEYRPGQRPPLEAQLIDLADEVAYNTADLDDGFEAGLFTLDQLTAEIPNFAGMRETVETQFAGASPRIQFQEALRLLINLLVTGLLQGTIDAVERAGVTDLDGVRRFPSRLIQFSGQSLETNAALKLFLRSNVYYAEKLVEERAECVRMVAELFEFFLRDPAHLPLNEYEPHAPPHRLACDYIAGMTDGYCRRTYRELILGET